MKFKVNDRVVSLMNYNGVKKGDTGIIQGILIGAGYPIKVWWDKVDKPFPVKETEIKIAGVIVSSEEIIFSEVKK